MVNGHKSAAHDDSPDGGTGKTCLGGGMHCSTASRSTCNKVDVRRDVCYVLLTNVFKGVSDVGAS